MSAQLDQQLDQLIKSKELAEMPNTFTLFLTLIMAASGADIRSILSIPQASTSKGPATKKPPPQRAKKPEGISRELYSLIGPSAPSIVAQLQKPRLKQKPRLNSGAIKWYVT